VELGSGAWCWFADPRAVKAGDVTYVGWIDGEGDVRVAAVDAGGLVTAATLHEDLGVDDHNNPALLQRSDGKLQVFYSRHGGGQMYYRIGEAIDSWSPERRIPTNTPGGWGYTYPNPLQLAAENGRIHLFWRGGDFNPAFATSDDGLEGQWHVERWQTADGGRTWTHRSLTTGSLEKNVRPVVARGGGPLWMRGGYINFRRYRTAIIAR
jgi:BNR repeat-containing family member